MNMFIFVFYEIKILGHFLGGYFGCKYYCFQIMFCKNLIVMKYGVYDMTMDKHNYNLTNGNKKIFIP